MKFQQDAASCLSAHRAKYITQLKFMCHGHHLKSNTYVSLLVFAGMITQNNMSSQSRRFNAVPSIGLGPVVQSIVSLTSSLRGQPVKCFTSL